jgi:hypothetical protein
MKWRHLEHSADIPGAQLQYIDWAAFAHHPVKLGLGLMIGRVSIR